MTNQFRHIDTKRPDGVSIDFRKLVTPDPHFTGEDFDDGGETAAGLEDGSLIAVGVQAVADVVVICNGTGTMHTLTSAGLWGITVASEADPYLDSVYAEELSALRDDLRAMGIAFAALAEPVQAGKPVPVGIVAEAGQTPSVTGSEAGAR